MIVFETQSIDHRSPTRTVTCEAARLPRSLMGAIRDQLIFRIRNRLGALLVTEEMTVIYPFLKDKAKTFRDYIACLKVERQGEYIALVIDLKRLKELDYPENLADILEYGNQTLPPCQHIRAVKMDFPFTAKVTQKRVLEECRSL